MESFLDFEICQHDRGFKHYRKAGLVCNGCGYSKKFIESGKKHWAEKTARKEHHCFKCGKLIPKGSKYYKSGHRFVTRLGCSISCHDNQDGKWK